MLFAAAPLAVARMAAAGPVYAPAVLPGPGLASSIQLLDEPGRPEIPGGQER